MDSPHVMPKLESQPYYPYNCETMPAPMSSHMQNGEPSSLSPSQRHKRLKRTTVSSLSSMEDEPESVEEGSESGVGQQPHYYHAKSPNSLSSQSPWPPDHPPPIDNDALRNDPTYRGNFFHNSSWVRCFECNSESKPQSIKQEGNFTSAILFNFMDAN